MPIPNNTPRCPMCNGKGWVLQPYYADEAPSLREQPCPTCFPDVSEAKGISGCLVLVGMVIAFVWLVWGMQ